MFIKDLNAIATTLSKNLEEYNHPPNGCCCVCDDIVGSAGFVVDGASDGEGALSMVLA